jgi:hypothetical protein
MQRRLEAALDDALQRVGQDLLARAAPLAPIDEGTLRASGHVELERLDAGRQEVVVSFNTPYAAVQHERTDYEHPRGGQAKYLEEPLKELAPRYERVLGEAIRRELNLGP